MITWHIEMVVFGVERKTRFSVETDSLSRAKQIALREFKKLSPKKKNLYLEARGDGVYIAVSNLQDVGEVKIERISVL